MDKSTGSPSLAHPISTLDEAAWDELVAEWPGESASPTCSAPTLDEGIAAGEVLPGHQPGVFKFVRVPDGWRRLRFIDVDLFRWSGDSKPEGYGEFGLKTARWYRKERERLGQPFDFDDAVRIARHWLADWPGSVNFEDLRDWLVASFFTIAGGHQPPLVDGDTYRFIDRNTKLRAVRLDENVVGRCIEKAASSGVHHEALHKAGELILRRNRRRLGGALSGWIAVYMAGSLPRCRKRPAGKNALRDRAIVAAVKRLEAEPSLPGLREARSERGVNAPIDWPALMPDVARALLGESNARPSTAREWRYRTHGSLVVHVDGAGDTREAMAWLRDAGFIGESGAGEVAAG